MRVLQLVTKRQLRGAEVFASVLSEDLERMGVQIYFLGIYPNSSPQKLEPAVFRNGDLTGRNMVSRVRALLNIIREFNPDVIQANGSVNLKYALMGAFFCGNKIPIVYRNISIISEWMKNPVKRLLYRAMFKRASKVVSVSDVSRIDFIKTLNYPEEKIVTLRRGIEVPDSVNASKSGKPYVLHVGSFTFEKNHAGLLRIFEKLSSKFPDLGLICLGDGPLKESIEEDILKKGLTDKIELPGFSKNTIDYYKGASLLLMTSTIEGIPGVVLEAAAWGVPSVAFNVGGMREGIIDNRTGYLIHSGDETDFIAKCSALLQHEEQRSQMGVAAFNHVNQNFNRKTVAANFLQLYKTL